jgi:hypothetical protein
MADEPAVSAATPKKTFDMRTVWRVAFWGGLAAIALAAVVVTVVSEIGTHRLQLALTKAVEPATTVAAVASIPQSPAEPDRKTQQLVEAVTLLTAERDHLNARIAGLERTLEEVTGSIKRLAVQQPAQQPVQQTVQQPVASAAKETTPIPAPGPAPAIGAPSATAATVASASEPMATPSSNALPVPLPPNRVANTVDAPAIEPPPVLKNEIGIDLGGAATLDGLRTHWSAVKANHGPLLAGLRPYVSVRSKKPGPTDYRLILGPFPDTAAATRLCARLVPPRTLCRPGIFSVQQLASH